MSRVIWKYELGMIDDQAILMPVAAKVLHVGWQGESLRGFQMWAESDSDTPVVERYFRIYGTGNPMDPDESVETYIGTVLMREYVWHVYEGLP